MKLTAEEIMRYGAETEREKTLIACICDLESAAEAVGDLEEEANNLEDDLNRADLKLAKFEDLLNSDLEDKELLEKFIELAKEI